MGGELASAQGGIDDLMLFVRDMVASFRVAIVAYRDRREEFETKSEGFTADAAEARKQLWQLSAEGGGDTPEAVYPALTLAYTQLQWRKESARTLVLVGDAPPHVGYGDACAKLAQRANEEGHVTTHAIQAKNKEVKHFAEIAAAGEGRCVLLKNNEALVPEIAGLTLADRFEDEFAEFFQVYLELCR
jgi:Mg-chelatase subunit ChlD